MPDGQRRSREHWADAMEAPPESVLAHTHRLPPVVRAAVVGLVVAVFLLAVAVGLMATQVVQSSEYMTGKGEQRDRERIELQERIDDRTRAAVCDVLDTLPEGGFLDRPRAKYNCGPGVPLEELTPEERREIANNRGIDLPDEPPGPRPVNRTNPSPPVPPLAAPPPGFTLGPPGGMMACAEVIACF